ncbi:hypothetical protein BDV3_002775 [Batrachochytrium dendrobatidis]|uniref:Rab-GAP TBC domain-containing protein n=1 Tax=Batrachochytrium dendrobatidis (strain JEL423) TaxID=403673 RepID=A0A177WZZ1_BATDL|nr:hypothetical protein BDEG_28246 [Batrachochytrium dendrobatidis JEL423]
MDLKNSDRHALFELYVGAVRLPPDNNFEEFRTLCLNGIPDTASVRQQSWKLLLGYLPFYKRLDWPRILRQQRGAYYSFVNELLGQYRTDQKESPSDQDAMLGLPDSNVNQDAANDHPLGSGQSPQLSIHPDEIAILEQIDMDARRTLPDLAFFQLPILKSKFSPLNPIAIPDTTSGFPPVHSGRALFDFLDSHKHQEGFGARQRGVKRTHASNTSESGSNQDTVLTDLHWEAIERILFIYAKLNPGIGYVQGMNEILGSLYYVIANDPDEESKAHAEADTFFLFTALMSKFRDHFIRHLDNMKQRSSILSSYSTASIDSLTLAVNSDSEHAQETGIGESMNRLFRLLSWVDPELYSNLVRKKLEPVFFAFRWLSVLFTQEFPLPDVIRIWDTLFADISLDITDYSHHHSRFESTLLLDQDTSIISHDHHNKSEFLIEFACAMITGIRSELLSTPFNDSLKLLQHYPTNDVETIISKALEYHTISVETPQKSFGLGNLFRRKTYVATGSEIKPNTEDITGEKITLSDPALSIPIMPMFGLATIARRFTIHHDERHKLESSTTDKNKNLEPPESKPSFPTSDEMNDDPDQSKMQQVSVPSESNSNALSQLTDTKKVTIKGTYHTPITSNFFATSNHISSGVSKLFQAMTPIKKSQDQLPKIAYPDQKANVAKNAYMSWRTAALPVLSQPDQHENNIVWQRSISIDDDDK